MIPQGLDSFSTPGKFIPVLFITFSDGVYVLDLFDYPCARRGSMGTHGPMGTARTVEQSQPARPPQPTCPGRKHSIMDQPLALCGHRPLRTHAHIILASG